MRRKFAQSRSGRNLPWPLFIQFIFQASTYCFNAFAVALHVTGVRLSDNLAAKITLPQVYSRYTNYAACLNRAMDFEDPRYQGTCPILMNPELHRTAYYRIPGRRHIPSIGYILNFSNAIATCHTPCGLRVIKAVNRVGAISFADYSDEAQDNNMAAAALHSFPNLVAVRFPTYPIVNKWH